MIRAAMYMRVSTDIQAREGDSIPAQRDALRKYINDRSDMICVGEYLDDGVSGQKINRDELQRLIDDVKADKIDVILITKLDRWFRSVRHYTATQEILDAHKVGWLAIWEPIYDTTTPSGRLIVNQMMAIAQFEAENTGQRIRQVQAYKVQQGEVISGACPPGYSIVNKHLVPDGKAAAVLEAYQYYSRTGNLRQTILHCTGQGLPRSIPGFKHILSNPIYTGTYRGNESFCTPIVPRDLYEDVQHKLSINVKVSQRHSYLFSGLIVCSECGRVMAAGSRNRKRGRNTDGIREYTYRCAEYYNYKPRNCCNNKIVRESALEKYMVANIRPMIQDVVLSWEISQQPQKDNAARIAQFEAKLKRLKDLYINDLITLDEYKVDKESYEKQIAELQVVVPKEKDLSALRDLLGVDIESLYWDMNREEKRYFWRSIVKNIRFGIDREYKVTFL